MKKKWASVIQCANRRGELSRSMAGGLLFGAMIGDYEVGDEQFQESVVMFSNG